MCNLHDEKKLPPFLHDLSLLMEKDPTLLILNSMPRTEYENNHYLAYINRQK